MPGILLGHPDELCTFACLSVLVLEEAQRELEGTVCVLVRRRDLAIVDASLILSGSHKNIGTIWNQKIGSDGYEHIFTLV